MIIQCKFHISDRVPEELWTEVHNIVQEAVTKIIPKKKKCKEVKLLSEKALKLAEKRREAKGKRRKGKIYPSECGVPRNSKEIRKPSSVISTKK